MNALHDSQLFTNANYQYHQYHQLQQAVNFGDVRRVNKLLAIDKLNVNFTLNSHETYLQTAIARHDLPMVRLLLGFRPNLNPFQPVSNAYSPLWMAMLCCYDDITELLVRAGANVNECLNLPSQMAPSDEYYFCGGNVTLLHKAVTRNHEDLVRLFLEYGADINCRNNPGSESPLQSAVFRQFITLAHMLIDAGANLESTNIDGMTAFHTALLTGNLELINLLIERGANVKAVDNNGKNALHFLAESRMEHASIAERLLNMGILVNQIERKCNMSPLDVALLSAKESVVKVLVKGGAKVVGSTSSRLSPICLASICCSTKTMKFLIKTGANVNEKTMLGETALHFAARSESVEKVKLLLFLDADVNAKDVNGLTALSWIGNQSCDAAKILVTHIARKIAEGNHIEEESMRVIRHIPQLLAHFEQCSREMELINRTAFYRRYTLRNFLDDDINRLAVLTKNVNFVNAFKSINLATILPNYARDITVRFMTVAFVRNTRDAIELHLEEALHHRLPKTVIWQIVDYLRPRDFPEISIGWQF